MPSRAPASRSSNAWRSPTTSSPRTRASRWTPRRRLVATPKARSPTATSSRNPKAARSMAEPAPVAGSAAELKYLRTPRAIRERCGALFALAQDGKLEHFALDESKLEAVVERVLAVTREHYPDLRTIPYHGRFRHFGAGGVDRLARLDAAMSRLSREEQLMTRFELVITSVLLDAGAGADWVYRDLS